VQVLWTKAYPRYRIASASRSIISRMSLAAFSFFCSTISGERKPRLSMKLCQGGPGLDFA